MDKKNDNLAQLIAKQRDLLKHEKQIMECLKQIKVEKNKLQVEHLQLESMIDEINDRASKVPKLITFQPLNLESSININEQELDLNISGALNNMIAGNDCHEEEEEEIDDAENQDIIDLLDKFLE